MTLHKYIFVLIAAIAVLSACKRGDFLDRYPLDAISEPVFFQTPNDLKLYVNQYYERGNFNVRTQAGGDLGTDVYLTQNSIDARLEGNRTINSAAALNYTNIRSINYFFQQYRNVEGDFDTYKQYVGEAHFFKAFFYFNLLKSIGDVQWLDNVLTTDSPELFEKRTARNIVADNIITHLDSAVMYLSESKLDESTRINKWVALLFQSRVALYEGTWQKYHNGTVFGVENANPNKYFEKAVQAAEQVMQSGLYSIYTTGKPQVDYVNLFGLREYATNTEVMFWTKMNIALGIHSHNKLSALEVPGGFGLTKEFADSYLCVDGKPISSSPLFKGYNNLSTETENRDPRMMQTIFNPSLDWQIDATGNVKKWQEVYLRMYTGNTFSSPTGYVRRKDYNPVMAYHHLNFEETPTAQYRYAEVLLNYIEAKAELGQASQIDLDMSINKIRNRAGMPDLVLNRIPFDSNWDFPALSPLMNEIRRERKIELVFENLRWDDIARWAAADELIVGKRPKGTKGSQFANTPSFPVDEDGFLDPFKARLPSGYGFKLDRDYLNPIPMSEITLNPQLIQNPGWD
ncbi:RagB/SusD family nutrient uptake outer membrane protein [Sphingobacterium hotanense]|uniref:RagB/SusD family nutrient uptake outer membrane protein n=1 Tax=Sphingobacterium hotanense TaxID=649196 RepID=A0ABT7NKX9_9SPHI|nr:RagB/SusD family nutrient uptake outer membrane protein [Sphingobacterium hotanense]MDM1047892.1 RagB/SusD family nutrient uptake outer membrane protein [Sphingobacterium hotanense]